MKFFRIIPISLLVIFLLFSCKKTEGKNQWAVEVKFSPVKITDLSAEFYDTKIPLESFQQKYPWFQGSVPDEDFVQRRTDTTEVKVYQESIKKIDVIKLSQDLGSLFGHIKHYFPQFVAPQVYLFSSGLQMADDPIIYNPTSGFLFIDISGFMGYGNKYYKGKELYMQKSMNPENIVPKVSEIIGINMVKYDASTAKFLDQMVYEGKLMVLQDAFLPDTPDYLKMHYTKEQYDWAKTNESYVWNYFVENDLVFSGDSRLIDRFIAPGPFSKFYAKIDNESSPRLGVFIGWQICRKFLSEKPETTLPAFLKMSATEIMNQSGYKP